MLADSKKINVAIIDDHPIVVEGLQKVLLHAYNYINVISFHSGADFINYLQQSTVPTDIAMIDITLPDINGIDLCKQIKTLHPQICALAFSNHNERSTIMRMLQNGASGYLLKNSSADEIVSCINEAMNGQIALSKETKEILAQPSPQDLQIIPSLTKREKEILKMVANGKTSVAIAGLLHVSPLTVETHRRNLMQKFNVKSMTAAIKVAIENHLL